MAEAHPLIPVPGWREPLLHICALTGAVATASLFRAPSGAWQQTAVIVVMNPGRSGLPDLQTAVRVALPKCRADLQ
jgi:hypothetical protein